MRTARATLLAFAVVLAAVAAVTAGVGATGVSTGVGDDVVGDGDVGDADVGAAGVGVSDVGNSGIGDSGVSGPVVAGAQDGDAGTDVQCEYPFTATDLTGSEVTVEDEPDRVVTLAPSAAQTLWEFDASEKVVGVTDNALYLDGADEKEVVAEQGSYEVETIIGLEPDLVLAPNVVPEDTVERLRSNGLTVYQFESAGSFEDVYDDTALTGQLAGECDEAAATVTDMRQRVEAIREAVSDEERPGAMYVFFGWTAGDGTFIHDVMETAGTRNVAAEAGVTGFGNGTVSEEVIANYSDDIEWLVLNSDAASHPSGTVYEQTTAMRENQTVVLNVDYLNQPAPRTVQALENLTRAVHPAAYEEAQAILASTPTASPSATATQGGDGATTTAGPGTASPTQSPTETGTPTETMAVTPTPEPDGTQLFGPGFGVVAAVLALLAVALLGRRR